ncbi:rhamnogalacturonan acetylesterase [Paenibacillus sp. LHD-117]|uniref:rhamnogalacturonan acetylesterase n=1 Tax=Paenibacillus sp. LHD-117 TaxID=3071412 RepID=UPI0027DEF066|nr:rhamnogalacturonan acetylesterase [Paenibacillus sp. LHD-117]MDQ6421812.1 rhamnogalacturonan acetylesterase [Paenibacillus sp. LHD-117]
MPNYKFDFGIGDGPADGYIQVLPDTLYDSGLGYGFLPGARIGSRDRREASRLKGAFCIPMDAEFVVDLPDGCYHVAVTVGDAIAPTLTSLQYGQRRFAFHQASTLAGQYAVHSFTAKATGGQLRLRFSGIAPRINTLDIAEAPEAVTVYLAGDSTVTDQETFPYAGWGQMLPLYFKAEIAIDNRARSGRSSRSFMAEGRLDAILKEIKAGDHLWIQFGHNDQKPDEARATEPFGSYKEMLATYVGEARARNAVPVLITPPHRRKFDGNGRIVDTHGDYLNAMKELALELDVPVIDLAAKSRALYEELGDESSKELFVWALPGEYMAFPDGARDDTHFHELGAVRIAGLVAEGVRAQLGHLPISLYLK